MRIEYYHASVYGNGAKVAEEFRSRMAEKGNVVNVHHIDEASPQNIPPADLYLFSSPGRMGKPIKGMRRFLEKVNLPAGTRYALLTTEAAPKPDRHGKLPDEAETCKWQRVRPVMIEILQDKGLVKIAEEKVYAMEMKGPLEDGWQKKIEDVVAQICGMEGGKTGA